MTLTTRLLVFFLATLAAVLAGFSAAVYGLAGAHLHRQSQARLDAAINTLIAAAEFTADAVEWEPEQRRLSLDGADAGNRIQWLVRIGKWPSRRWRRVAERAQAFSRWNAAADSAGVGRLIELARIRLRSSGSSRFGRAMYRTHRSPPLRTQMTPIAFRRHPQCGRLARTHQATLRQLALALGGLSLVVLARRGICRPIGLPARPTPGHADGGRGP